MAICNKASIYIFGLIWILVTPVCFSATKVYRSTDAEGNVIFSDTPQKGSEAIKVQPVQTFAAPEASIHKSPSKDKPEPVAEFQGYKTFVITQPQEEQTIWNNPGNVSVSVNVVPQLQSGDKIEILLNNSLVAESKSGTSFQLTNIDRGEHSLKAQIVNESGEVLKQTKSVTFFLHQATINRR